MSFREQYKNAESEADAKQACWSPMPAKIFSDRAILPWSSSSSLEIEIEIETVPRDAVTTCRCRRADFMFRESDLFASFFPKP